VAERLTGAGISWRTTVRPSGRPHVTPLIGVRHATGGQVADVFRVVPRTVRALGKDPYSQNRYTF